MTNDHDAQLWVRSDISPDGTYILTVEYGDDTVFSLDREGAVRYATHILAVVARVEYDAAVYHQLSSTGVEAVACAQAIRDLRNDRPPLPARWPIGFEGIVASKTMTPEVTISVNGEVIGQAGTGAIVEHAMNVLECLPVTELDAGYRRWLVGVIGLPDDKARTAIDGLTAHRRRT